MINANELRKGNWLKNSLGWHLQIEWVQHETVFAINKNQSSQAYLKDFEPILLTPEILEKAGFRKWGWTDYVIGNANTFMSIAKSGNSIINPSCHLPITSLHQLQNLYFALTGEELQIQL